MIVLACVCNAFEVYCTAYLIRVHVFAVLVHAFHHLVHARRLCFAKLWLLWLLLLKSFDRIAPNSGRVVHHLVMSTSFVVIITSSVGVTTTPSLSISGVHPSGGVVVDIEARRQHFRCC